MINNFITIREIQEFVYFLDQLETIDDVINAMTILFGENDDKT